MEQHRIARVGETGYPRENPLTSGIVRHDSHLRKSGASEKLEVTVNGFQMKSIAKPRSSVKTYRLFRVNSHEHSTLTPFRIHIPHHPVQAKSEEECAAAAPRMPSGCSPSITRRSRPGRAFLTGWRDASLEHPSARSACSLTLSSSFVNPNASSMKGRRKYSVCIKTVKRECVLRQLSPAVETTQFMSTEPAPDGSEPIKTTTTRQLLILCAQSYEFQNLNKSNSHGYLRTGETGDPRVNPQTNGIVRHDTQMRKPGRDHAGNGELLRIALSSHLDCVTHGVQKNQYTELEEFQHVRRCEETRYLQVEGPRRSAGNTDKRVLLLVRENGDREDGVGAAVMTLITLSNASARLASLLQWTQLHMTHGRGGAPIRARHWGDYLSCCSSVGGRVSGAAQWMLVDVRAYTATPFTSPVVGMTTHCHPRVVADTWNINQQPCRSLQAQRPSRQANNCLCCVPLRYVSIESPSGADAGIMERGKREIPEKTRRPAESSSTTPTCGERHHREPDPLRQDGMYTIQSPYERIVEEVSGKKVCSRVADCARFLSFSIDEEQDTKQ
ncbi:hypothetical protein PR048_026685 [Dryococelus australis]|uniref:Uncharacterized protein n=1 Tax=Dryococelus australis TaxID=614101 RepID=A0ABQ9GM29_9NEOP|nr:hypothetical protein PR048_026685 [Dryococelus australis]